MFLHVVGVSMVIGFESMIGFERKMFKKYENMSFAKINSSPPK